MNWEAIGAIGQAVSALALIIVIVQVRLSTGETLRSIRQGRYDVIRGMMMDQAQSEWLSRVVAKGMQAYDAQIPYQAELIQRGLAAEEASALNAWMMCWWISDTQGIAHIDQLAQGERASFDAMLRAQYQGEMKLRFLELNRHRLNPDAVRYVDNLLAQPG